MNFKTILLATSSLVTCGAFADVPVVSGVEMTQDSASRVVTISYSLSDAPCVVTVDIQTNTLADAAGAWVSIGGKNFSTMTGDVFKEVAARQEGEKYLMTWKPHLEWPDQKIAAGCIRAVVTAYASDDRPDVMVVGLAQNVQDRVRYYPALDYLPGGLLENEAYRTSSIVLKRMHSRNLTWVKGSMYEEKRDTDGREDCYEVTLDHDYYVGVFQLTQQQWYEIVGSYRGSYAGNRRQMRPLESTSFQRMRICAVDKNAGDSTYDYPHDPHPDSYLGKLYARTGMKFDLPSEAEWEFAARGGHGERCWGDGVQMTYSGTGADTHLTKMMRCAANNDTNHTDDPALGGTSEVGYYGIPNSYGLYDMGGNVAEFCLDFYTTSISTLKSKTRGEVLGTTEAGSSNHVIHGCDPAVAAYHRPARCNARTASDDNKGVGYRLVCRDILK